MLGSDARFGDDQEPRVAQRGTRQAREPGDGRDVLRDDVGREFSAREHRARELRGFGCVEHHAAFAHQCGKQRVGDPLHRDDAVLG